MCTEDMFDEWFEIKFDGKRAGAVHLKGRWHEKNEQYNVMAIFATKELGAYSENLLKKAGLFGKCFSVEEANAAEMELNRQPYSLLIF